MYDVMSMYIRIIIVHRLISAIFFYENLNEFTLFVIFIFNSFWYYLDFDYQRMSFRAWFSLCVSTFQIILSETLCDLQSSHKLFYNNVCFSFTV